MERYWHQALVFFPIAPLFVRINHQGEYCMKISFPISVLFQILLVLPLVSQEIVANRRTESNDSSRSDGFGVRKSLRYPLAVPGVSQPAAGLVAAISSPLAGRLQIMSGYRRETGSSWGCSGGDGEYGAGRSGG